MKTKWEIGESSGKPCLKNKWSTIWDNGTWFTWDKHGVGGENGVEETITEACKQSELAAKRQGFI